MLYKSVISGKNQQLSFPFVSFHQVHSRGIATCNLRSSSSFASLVAKVREFEPLNVPMMVDLCLKVGHRFFY